MAKTSYEQLVSALDAIDDNGLVPTAIAKTTLKKLHDAHQEELRDIQSTIDANYVEKPWGDPKW